MATKGTGRRRSSPTPDREVAPKAPSSFPSWLGPAAQLAFVLVAAIGVYSFVAVAREGEVRRRCGSVCLLHPNYAAANRRIPSFTLPDYHGQQVSTDSLKGKVVVLNFWTKTCGPCLEEMPEIAELAKILRDRKDVAVVTVSIDDGPNAVRDTLKSILREEPPFAVLFDPESEVVGGKFGTHLFPETWIVDKSGVIRARFDGAREWGSSGVVELVDEIRAGTTCPVTVKESRSEGEAAQICESIVGG
jgi:thiol-disulfide isomerase/thioredoxin